jgi:hypothetical protein
LTPSQFKKVASKRGFVVDTVEGSYLVAKKSAPKEYLWELLPQRLITYTDEVADRELATLEALHEGDIDGAVAISEDE